jgi:hypothetical protein
MLDIIPVELLMKIVLYLDYDTIEYNFENINIYCKNFLINNKTYIFSELNDEDISDIIFLVKIRDFTNCIKSLKELCDGTDDYNIILVRFYALNQKYTDITYINPDSVNFEIGTPYNNELEIACYIGHIPLLNQLLKHFENEIDIVDLNWFLHNIDSSHTPYYEKVKNILTEVILRKKITH